MVKKVKRGNEGLAVYVSVPVCARERVHDVYKPKKKRFTWYVR